MAKQCDGRDGGLMSRSMQYHNMTIWEGRVRELIPPVSFL